MVIDLTASEKSTFFRFLLLYLGSSLVLLILVGFLYYENEKKLYTDLTKSRLQNIVSQISNEVIISHMKDLDFNEKKYLNSYDYRVSFYDINKKIVFGNLKKDIDFSKNITIKNGELIVVDSSTVGHLGIEYIVIKDTSLGKKLNDLKYDIFLIFLFLYSLISLVGFYLAKLFLLPIKKEREKINNFIKDTTHELNTPISAILMSTESKELNEKQIERISLSAKRVSEIYKDLTYIFLEEQKKQNILKKERLDLLIKEQLEYFSILASKKGIDINHNLEVFEYKIQRDDFIRIINNLISNAIKYNKVDGSIDIKLKNGTLEVKDTGIGIPKDKIDDIFKRYYRATSQKGGFGIGLNIVSKACKNYNIPISVESTKNKGTLFKLQFN